MSDIQRTDQRHDDEQRLYAFAQQNQHGINRAILRLRIDLLQFVNQMTQSVLLCRVVAMRPYHRNLILYAAVQARIARADFTFDIWPNRDEGGEFFLPLAQLPRAKRAQTIAQQLHPAVKIVGTRRCGNGFAAVVAVDGGFQVLRLLADFIQIQRRSFQGHAHQRHRCFHLAVMPHAGIAYDALVAQPCRVELLIGGFERSRIMGRGLFNRLI